MLSGMEGHQVHKPESRGCHCWLFRGIFVLVGDLSFCSVILLFSGLFAALAPNDSDIRLINRQVGVCCHPSVASKSVAASFCQGELDKAKRTRTELAELPDNRRSLKVCFHKDFAASRQEVHPLCRVSFLVGSWCVACDACNFSDVDYMLGPPSCAPPGVLKFQFLS